MGKLQIAYSVCTKIAAAVPVTNSKSLSDLLNICLYWLVGLADGVQYVLSHLIISLFNQFLMCAPPV